MPRQLWQKVLSVGKDAMDMQSMQETAKKCVPLLISLVEAHKDLKVEELPVIEDPAQIKELEEMVPMRLRAVAQDLGSADDSQMSEMGKSLTSALDGLFALVDSHGTTTFGTLMTWVRGLWVNKPDPSFRVEVSEADHKNLQGVKTAGSLNFALRRRFLVFVGEWGGLV